LTTLAAATPSKEKRSIPAAPDYAAIKHRQQATWASGDFAVIGITLQIVGESLAEAADIRAGERVLDVAAGNGNATLAAARRRCGATDRSTARPFAAARSRKRGG
jgi:16S rRNA C967 or C1407 C5-methylase (RsmB/RsmF family)